MKISVGLLWIFLVRIMVIAAAEDLVTEVNRSDRQRELSVRSDGHPVPGPYRVTVYLPPDYSTGKEGYRVIYVFD